jgi:small subunit ribosomal protein S6
MREYELVLIIHPDLDEAAFNEIVERVSGWITEDGGEIIKTDVWGKRQLAYPIRKLNEGQYMLLQTKMNAQLGTTIERNLRYMETVLRYMLIAK